MELNILQVFLTINVLQKVSLFQYIFPVVNVVDKMTQQPIAPVSFDRDRLLAIRSSVDNAVNSFLRTSDGNSIDGDEPANMSNA